MGELSKFTDDNESAPDEDKKDSKETQARRWVNPPLVPRSLELARDRAANREALPPPPPPTLLEQVLSKDLLEKQRADEDDAEGEEESRPEERPLGTEEAVQTDSEASEEPAEGAPVAEAAPAEAPEQAAAEDEAAPAEEPDDTVLHIRRQPDVPAAEYAPAADTEEEEPVPAAGGSGFGGSGTTPPPPPPAVPPAAAAANFGPVPNWNMAPANTSANTYNTAPAPQVSVEQYRADTKETARDAEKRGLRKGLVAGFITGYVLKAYLANRKRERYEKATEKQLSERDEQINQLQREQQRLARQVAARAEDYRQRQESPASNRPAGVEAGAARAKAEAALSPQEAHPEEPIFDQEGNEIVLQPGWHVERSAGGYSVVLDEHNRVVHDAIRYGEAFKREQKREQLSDDMFAAVGSGAAVGGHAGSQYVAASYSPSQQASGRPSLPAPMPEHHEVDLKHRLPEPRSQFMATIASPWLWTAIALLIIVYFIAALA